MPILPSCKFNDTNASSDKTLLMNKKYIFLIFKNPFTGQTFGTVVKAPFRILHPTSKYLVLVPATLLPLQLSADAHGVCGDGGWWEGSEIDAST